MNEYEIREAVRNSPEKSEMEECIIKKTRKLQKVLGMNEHEVTHVFIFI
jgi:hypothetical protein